MDLKKKDLSFIIPCHNLEDYICFLLDSLVRLNTENLNIEYIFVLDSCTDNTQKKIEKRMEGLPYKIICCNVHSCGLARNIGLDNCNGEYIWFIDGDDQILQTDFLQSILLYMKENNASIVKLRFDSNDPTTLHCTSMVWQYIFKKDFIGGLRFANITPKEDVLFMKQLCIKNNISSMPLPYFSKVPYYYYQHNRYGSNMSKARNIYDK